MRPVTFADLEESFNGVAHSGIKAFFTVLGRVTTASSLMRLFTADVLQRLQHLFDQYTNCMSYLHKHRDNSADADLTTHVPPEFAELFHRLPKLLEPSKALALSFSFVVGHSEPRAAAALSLSLLLMAQLGLPLDDAAIVAPMLSPRPVNVQKRLDELVAGDVPRSPLIAVVNCSPWIAYIMCAVCSPKRSYLMELDSTAKKFVRSWRHNVASHDKIGHVHLPSLALMKRQAPRSRAETQATNAKLARNAAAKQAEEAESAAEHAAKTAKEAHDFLLHVAGAAGTGSAPAQHPAPDFIDAPSPVAPAAGPHNGPDSLMHVAAAAGAGSAVALNAPDSVDGPSCLAPAADAHNGSSSAPPDSIDRPAPKKLCPSDRAALSSASGELCAAFGRATDPWVSSPTQQPTPTVHPTSPLVASVDVDVLMHDAGPRAAMN
jgi:hypothetical protein